MPPRLDFDYVCRLCMILVDGSRNGQFAPLFKEEQSLELARKIADIADVKVIYGDGLPGQVCRSCMEQVDAFYAFRQKCRRSDRQFRQYLSSDFYTNSALPSASGDEHTPLTSDCATDNADPKMSKEVRTINVSIIKEEIQTVAGHYMQACKGKLPTEAYKLENNVKLSGLEGNYGNVVEGKLTHAPRFPEGTSWVTTGETLHMRELLCNVSTWLAGGARRGVEGGGGLVVLDDAVNSSDRSILALDSTILPRDSTGRVLDSTGLPRDSTGRLLDSSSLPRDSTVLPLRDSAVLPPSAKRLKKNFPCDLCSKTLGSESSLKVHRLNHSGARPFRCTVDDCAKRFAQYGNLQTHIRSHLGIRPYSCRTCGASFVQLANLQSHERKHSAGQQHACRACGASFDQASALHAHALGHCSERAAFECRLCGRRFKSETVLGRHTSKMHGESSSDARKHELRC